MITSFIQSGNQMLNTRWTCSTEASGITPTSPSLIRDFCLCDYECEWSEYAFTSFENEAEINDTYKNDYRKFLLNPVLAASTYSFTIVKSDGTEVEIVDNSYGELFEQGFNASQPLQVGIRIDWWKVANDTANGLGYGDYKIKSTLVELGETIEVLTHNFIVCPFDTNRANETVKIEVINKGVTQNGIDYSGLGEYVNMVRVGGGLSDAEPEIERNNYTTSIGKTINNQTEKTNNYALKIDNIPSGIGDVILDDGSLMHWFVTDYNVFNYKDYRKLEVEVINFTSNNTPQYSKRFFDVSLRKIDSKENRKFAS